MTTSVELKYDENHISKERIFFLCEECLWSMTSLDKSHSVQIIGKEGTCPLQYQLSSFPLRLNDSLFTATLMRGKSK
jgi:hypothetical protein